MLTGARPCHSDGSAPGTPALANRANCVAAQSRSASSTAQAGAHTTTRNRPTTAAADNTRGAETGCIATGSPSPSAHWAISKKNADGSTASCPPPPASLSTAVTSNRRRARPIAVTSSRRSSASNGARIEASFVTPSSSSSSRWVPSTPPRGTVLGHKPSCRPAITTRSHSCPSAACALRTMTCSVGAAGSGRTTGSCSAVTCSTSPRRDAPEVRDT
ncbi:Uncharacterised protein [Mycobacterium tuberculosis]|nr:Uncharacterised protein [Mycobacterium tuberculosis]